MKDMGEWAKLCPKSIGALGQAVVDGAAIGAQLKFTPEQNKGFAAALAHVAATCFAAGVKAVRESNGAISNLEGMGGD